jgi:hypothetical protein
MPPVDGDRAAARAMRQRLAAGVMALRAELRLVRTLPPAVAGAAEEAAAARAEEAAAAVVKPTLGPFARCRLGKAWTTCPG